MLQRLLTTVTAFLKQLTPAQRATYAILAVALMVGLATAVYLGTRATYRTAFSNIDGADGAAIARKLDDLKVPYRVAQGGGAIEVADEDVSRVRMIMAGEGLPKGGGTGFEIFDAVDVGLTDSLFEVKKLRAYQAQLKNAIESLSPVTSCQVTLSVPRQSVFVREQKRPSASVVLKLRAGLMLGPTQAGAIAHLVCAAVGQGMSPQDVTIVDTNLNLLSRPAGSEEELGSDLLAFRKNTEDHLARSAQSMLDETVGAHKALVRVSAELMTDRVEETDRKVDPETATPARERKTNRDTSDAANPAAAASATAAVQGTSGSPTPPRSDTSTESESTYVYSETSRTVKREPGRIERLSVALMLDQSLADKRTELEQIVQRAVGFKSERGDQMQTSAVSFTTPVAPEADGGSFERFLPLVRYLAEAIVVLVALLVLRSVLTKLKTAAATTPAPAEPAPVAVTPPPEDRDLLFRDVVSAAKRDPSQAADILNEWMSDEEVAAR